MESRIILLFLILGINYVVAVQAPVKELNDGNKIPVVALGTGRGTAHEGDNEEVRHAVFWAIEAGYRHIDTAAAYNDEKEVGQGIADAISKGLVKREDVFVTTKVFPEKRRLPMAVSEIVYLYVGVGNKDKQQVGQGIAGTISKRLVKRQDEFVTTNLWNDKHHQEQVVPALRESLSKLGLDYVDLYLMHFPVAFKDDGTPDDVDYLETWKGLEEAKRLGLAKSIGVSNFNTTQLDRLIANSQIKPAVNQIEVNPTLTQEPLVSHCRKQGLAVMAYSPFGFLVSRKKQDAPPPRFDDPELGKMAQKYNKTTSQIVLRYLIERDLIPIPKSTNKERLAQNIDLFDFHLTEEEIKTIGAFNKNIRVIEPKVWKDHPNYPFERQ